MSGQEDLQKWLQQLKNRSESKPQQHTQHSQPQQRHREEPPRRKAPGMQSMLEEIFSAAKAAQQAKQQGSPEMQRRMNAENQRLEEERRREQAERAAAERRRREKAKKLAQKRLEAERAAQKAKEKEEATNRNFGAKIISKDKRQKSPFAKALRKRLLTGPSALRKAIVLAEILGKPKALRRDSAPGDF